MKKFIPLKLDDSENHEKPKPKDIPPADAPVIDRIIANIQTVYDPEIPVDIFALGLIYSVRFNEDTKKSRSGDDIDIAGMLCRWHDTGTS